MLLSFSPDLSLPLSASLALSVSNGFSSETTNSPLRSSPLHQFPTHTPSPSNPFPAVACVPRTFRSLSISRFHPLVHVTPPFTFSLSLSLLLSLGPCFCIHFVPRQPRDRASNLRGLIKRPFVTVAHIRVCMRTHAHRCTYSRVAGFVSAIARTHVRRLSTFAERNCALQPAR